MQWYCTHLLFLNWVISHNKIRVTVGPDIRLSVREDILNMIMFYRNENADCGDYEETGELVEIEETKRKVEEEEEARKKLTKYEEQQILSPAEAKRHIASSFFPFS